MSADGFAVVLKHYRNPSNYGPIADPDATCEDVNELCGDRVRFEVALGGATVARLGFVGDGCALMIAAASILSERATGAVTGSVAEISVDDVIGFLGSPVRAARRRCVELPLATLQRAVKAAVESRSAG